MKYWGKPEGEGRLPGRWYPDMSGLYRGGAWTGGGGDTWSAPPGLVCSLSLVTGPPGPEPPAPDLDLWDKYLVMG